MVKWIRDGHKYFRKFKSKVFNDPAKWNIRYTTLLNVNLLLILLLVSSNMGDNTTLFFMSIFPVTIYMNPFKQKGDIFEENNKKSGIYRWTNKLSGKTKSLPVCAIKMDTGVSYEFASITKAAEFLKVTIYFLNRCIREGKSCKGYSVTRKK